MNLSLGNRNSAIGIILGMNLIFFAVWLVILLISVHNPQLNEATNKLYGVFQGVNSALMLILNSEAKNGNGAAPPLENSQDGNPAKPK